MEDSHIFGESDYLSADEYATGTPISIKVTDFLGRLPYMNHNGDKERAGYFKVLNQKGSTKEFRLGVKNEIVLKSKFNVLNYIELVGATLILQVKKYNLGNGFVVVDLKREAATAKQPGQVAMEK